MDFVNEVSNDPNDSKVPRNDKILLFWSLDLLFLSDFFGVDPTENEMEGALNLKKYGAQTVYNFFGFKICLKRFERFCYSKRVFFATLTMQPHLTFICGSLKCV